MNGAQHRSGNGLSSSNEENRPLLGATTPSYTNSEIAKPPNGEILNEPSTSDLYWILFGLWSAVFLGALDTTIVAALLTPIGSYFEQSQQASYLGSAYLLSVCCFTPLYGRLSDITGRKGAMLVALSLFSVGTLLCGLAPSMKTLIIARAIGGMGGGGIMIVSSITVSDLIPLKRRGIYQGLANITYGLGAALGGPVGGFINDRLGWRIAFLFQIPIVVVSAALVLNKVNVKLPAKFAKSQTVREKLIRIDWAGSATLVTCIGAFVVAVSLKSAEGYSWSDPLVIGLLVASAGFAVLFFLAEKHWAKEPVMPLRLLTQRTPLFVALSNLFISVCGMATLYNLPLYFSAVKLQSATDSGLHLLPNAITLSIGSIFAGWMIRRSGKYWLLIACSALCTIASLSLIATWTEKTSVYHLWLDVAGNGFGNSSVITSTLIALIASVDREDIAVATGISYLFRTTGQVLGVSFTGSLIQAILLRNLREKIQGPGAAEIIDRIRHSTAVIPTLEPELRRAAVDSYAAALRVAFICQAAAAFIGFLCTLPIQEFPLPGSHEEQAEIERRRSQNQTNESSD